MLADLQDSPFAEVDLWADSEVVARPEVERLTGPGATFRGVRVSSLLDRAGASPDAAEVTLVANDGFRATFAVQDVRTWPVQVSVARDGEPIPRSRGGPLFGTLPNVAYPAVGERYLQSWWVFYVTHVIVDTAEIALRVGDRVFTAADLAALEQVTVTAPHGFRTGWDAGLVPIEGVRVRDVLASAGADVQPDGRVRIRVVAPVPDDDEHALRLPAAALAEDDFVLGLRYGADHRPIPARLGGPLVLVEPAAYAQGTASEWPTMVRGLDVERAP